MTCVPIRELILTEYHLETSIIFPLDTSIERSPLAHWRSPSCLMPPSLSSEGNVGKDVLLLVLDVDHYQPLQHREVTPDGRVGGTIGKQLANEALGLVTHEKEWLLRSEHDRMRRDDDGSILKGFGGKQTRRARVVKFQARSVGQFLGTPIYVKVAIDERDVYPGRVIHQNSPEDIAVLPLEDIQSGIDDQRRRRPGDYDVRPEIRKCFLQQRDGRAIRVPGQSHRGAVPH